MNAPSRRVEPHNAGESVSLRKAERGVWRANVARDRQQGGAGREK